MSEERENRHYLQVNGLSYHFQRNNYNEVNKGLGYEFRSRDNYGLLAGYYDNSYHRHSKYLAASVFTDGTKVLGGSLSLLGAVGVATNYPEYIGINRSTTKLVGLVGASWEHSSGVGLNLMGFPHKDGLVMANIIVRMK